MTSTWKIVYIDKFDDSWTIKMKPVEVKSITLVKQLMVRLRNLKLGILIEYQNIFKTKKKTKSFLIIKVKKYCSVDICY